MHNPLTDLLQIKVPVIDIAAPMAVISWADVAAAVAKAGGLGLIGAGYIEPDRLTSIYTAALQQLSSTAEAHGAVGVGLMNFACSRVPKTLFVLSRQDAHLLHDTLACSAKHHKDHSQYLSALHLDSDSSVMVAMHGGACLPKVL